MTDVVHSPERFKTWWERSSDKVIVTVSIALILLGRIVSTRVSGVLGRILLLASKYINIYMVNVKWSGPKRAFCTLYMKASLII